MNKELMFSSATDEWETPTAFFRALDAEFHFDVMGFIELKEKKSGNRHLINTAWVEEVIDHGGEVAVYFAYHEDDASQDFIKVSESYDEVKKKIQMG